MKIHIVKKGDTFWEIAKEYGVNFEQLKQLNPQISSPDMIMPGMKIKIPSPTKPVKKETVAIKETKIPVVKEKPKEVLPKPLPIITEDDHQKPKEVKVEMPIKHVPKTPPKPVTPKKEKPIMEQVPKQPINEMIQMPIMKEELTINFPEVPQYHPPKEQQQQMPVSPMCHHCHQPCCQPVHHHYFPVMGQMQMPHQQHMQPGHMMHHMPMPVHPQHTMMNPHDCGCGSMPPFPQHQMREQMPQPFPLENFDQLNHQPGFSQQQTRPNFRELPTYPPFPAHNLNHSIGNPFPMPPGYQPTSDFNNQEDRESPINEKLQTDDSHDEPIND